MIGIMVLYLKLENPEQNLDKRTGLFNQNAFMEYIQQLFVEGKQFSIFCFYFEDLFQQNMPEDLYENLSIEVSRYLFSIRHTCVFNNAENEIVLVFEDRGYAEEIVDKLWHR